MKIKNHIWNIKKSYRIKHMIWVPALCGTRVVVDLKYACRSLKVTCKKCLRFG